MILNRAQAPAFKQVNQIDLIQAKEDVLDNGLKVYTINGGEQDIIRIEFLFNNIGWTPVKPLLAFAGNSMLVEGTPNLNSAQIAERIDYYGAFLQTDYNYDYSSVTLYTLNKHLKTTLSVVSEIIKNSVFPQDELNTFIQNQKQKLSVNLEKNDFIARRIFNNALFNDSIYGYIIEENDYEALQRTDLIAYHEDAYTPANCTIIVSGKVAGNTLSILNELFGKNWVAKKQVKENQFQFHAGSGRQHYTERKDSLQSAIRIGHVSINRAHPDFPALQVLNTVLGGYFGSRLMANIREDKGFTYGIGSVVISLQNAGYFFIATEVGAEVTQPAIQEIEKEIALLKTEPVSEEELDLVKNYMLGSLLGSLENSFSHADKFKNIHFLGLGYDYYDYYIETVKNITSNRVQEMAAQYLDYEKMEKVIVGKP
ncbi:M16 family metallopeptidase [Rubrolithibacter danxiaensis]|uniref:M16 family metallopeptidase n=1 Tax=Rubrolithibacter danxiaensis TaxID=3390805 RepID=UPI003BF7A21A